MTAVYFLLNYYPFWALPMVVICGELAYYYFNRHARGKFALMLHSSSVWKDIRLIKA